MRALLYFTPLFARLKAPLALSLLLSLLTLVAGVALLGVSGWFLTAAALSTAGAAFNLFAPSAGVRGLSFLRILSRYGERLTGHDVTLRLLSDIRRWLFTRLFPLVPLKGRFGRGEIVSRLTADVEALDTAFLLALGPIATALAAGAVMTTVLGFLLPDAALGFALAFFGAVAIVPVALTLAARRAGQEAAAASGKLRRLVLDGLDGHQDLVVFGATGETEAAIGEAAHGLALPRRRLGILGAIAATSVQILTGVALLSALIAGATAFEQNAIDGPLLAALLLAIIASFESCAMLVRSTTRLAGAAAAAERLRELGESDAAIGEVPHPVELPPGGAISFEHVFYGYDSARPVIAGIDLSIASGDCVAIIGPSGSGKSTLARLLVRLADPTTGRVLINGVDLRRCSIASLRQRVAMMTQDAPVFLDTIRANLLIGQPDADDAALERVLRSVRLWDFVSELPAGLSTLVGELGQTLSVGQARRLCLARTLLSRAGIIVLDEPTSSLDAETETEFLADLPAIAAGRTVVVITHATPAASFSQIVTIRDGRIELPSFATDGIAKPRTPAFGLSEALP